MKNSKSLCFLLLATIFTSACTGVPIKEAADELAKKPICCVAYSELTFEPLRSAQRQVFDLESSSPVMDFPEGRSYFRAFSLPPGARSLTIHSINSEYLPKTSYVDPIIVVLNENRQSIARFESLSFRKENQRYMAAFLEWYFSGRILLPPNSSYVILYANNKSQRVLETRSANGRLWPVPPAPIGTLAVIAD